MKALAAALLAFVLTACATAPVETDPLNPLAERYVKLILQIGEKEAGYVDAYHGPPDWAAEAKAHPQSLEQLSSDAAALVAAVDATPVDGLAPLELKRRAFLRAHLTAAQFRLRMIGGYRAPFADEAEALFGVRPELKPLSSYEAALARLEALAPGEGTLAERVARLRGSTAIPPGKIRPVIEAAIAECRRRTRAHIALPARERFDLELVTGKPWGGYNYFQGDARSLIQINTDVAPTIEGALGLGCHEGYPGHHVQNVLMEKLYRDRGWVEFSVWPLFAPVGFVAEGTSNAGVALAFPGKEGRAFERTVLYPIAEKEPPASDPPEELAATLRTLRSAEYTIADAYLAGRMDRTQAAAAIGRYLALSPARAQKRLDFIDAYRSYIINYGLGEEMADAALQRAGPSPEARWRAMETLLSEPTLPADLGAP